MDEREKVNQEGGSETVGQWLLGEAVAVAPLRRMAGEAETLLGNLILKELGWEAAELFRATLEARELQNVDAEAQRALARGLAVGDVALRGCRESRKRLGRAMYRFALRGGV